MQQWDRLQPKGKRKGETAGNYAAFDDFLRLGPGRKISDLAVDRKHGSYSRLRQLSVTFKWTPRAQAYDVWMVQQARKERERQMAKLERRRAEQQFAAQDIIENLRAKLVAYTDKLLGLSPVDVSQTTTHQTPEGGLIEDVKRVKGLPPRDVVAVVEGLLAVLQASVDGVRPAPKKGRAIANLIEQAKAESKVGGGTSGLPDPPAFRIVPIPELPAVTEKDG